MSLILALALGLSGPVPTIVQAKHALTDIFASAIPREMSFELVTIPVLITDFAHGKYDQLTPEKKVSSLAKVIESKDLLKWMSWRGIMAKSVIDYFVSRFRSINRIWSIHYRTKDFQFSSRSDPVVFIAYSDFNMPVWKDMGKYFELVHHDIRAVLMKGRVASDFVRLLHGFSSFPRVSDRLAGEVNLPQ